MRTLLVVGVILVVLGVASLVVPIPKQERHGIDVGSVSLGVETTTREKVHPAISAILIAVGAGLIFASRKK